MKKLRQKFSQIKEGFLDAKCKTSQPAIDLAYKVLAHTIYFVIALSGLIFMPFGLAYISYIILGIAVIILIIFSVCPKVIKKASSLSTKLLFHFFGKYGRVVTKEDWKRIKKSYPKLYKWLFSKKSVGHCYFASWRIALCLKDAELMYGSYRTSDSSFSGHAIIVKNNCVYDTNDRMHYDLDEYKEWFEFSVYKMFSEKEYRNEKFFDNIRDGFVQWCAERNAYCNPE